MPRCRQMWEQTGVIVAGDAECMCCVTMGPRIHNQHHRDDLAVVQDGGRAASLPWAVLRFKRLTAVTDQHEPERDASIQHSSVIWRTAPAQPALPTAAAGSRACARRGTADAQPLVGAA